MASTMLASGLEVPSVGGGASSADVYSSQTRTLDIPNFDEDGYEEWVIAEVAAAMLAAYEKEMGRIHNTYRRNIMLAGLEMDAERIVCAPKKKLKNKTVSFFVDVPFKHDETTGEVFTGPISSQKTYEKEEGEEQLVFVNPKSSE